MRKKKVEQTWVHIIAEGNLFGYNGFVPASKAQKFIEWVFKCFDRQTTRAARMSITAQKENKWWYDDLILNATLKVSTKIIDMTELNFVALDRLPAFTMSNGFHLQVEAKVQFFADEQFRLGFIEEIASNVGEYGWVKIKDWGWISCALQIEHGCFKPGEIVSKNAKPVEPETNAAIEGF